MSVREKFHITTEFFQMVSGYQSIPGPKINPENQFCVQGERGEHEDIVQAHRSRCPSDRFRREEQCGVQP